MSPIKEMSLSTNSNFLIPISLQHEAVDLSLWQRHNFFGPDRFSRVDVYWRLANIQAKEIESLPQTKMFESHYICNLMLYTFDFQNLDYLIYLRSMKLGHRDIGVRKSEFVAKT